MMRKIVLVLSAIFLAGIFLTACAPKKIEPLKLAITEEDKKQVEFPPSKDELVLPRNDIVFLDEELGLGVSKERLQPINEIIEKVFRLSANFNIVPQEKIDAILSQADYKDFRANNIIESIQFAKEQDATFLGLKNIQITSSRIKEKVDTFVASVEISLFTTGTRQLISKNTLSYDSENPIDFVWNLKKNLVETYLPLRGFITETRGNHQVAKITLGSSLGIKVGRKLLVRNRIVYSTIAGGVSADSGMQRTIIRYSPEVLAKVEVIEVRENESWVKIKSEDRLKIAIGQGVFTEPEERDNFDRTPYQKSKSDKK